MNNSSSLIATCLSMALLVSLVGLRLLYCRVSELRSKRIHPQATAQSAQMAALTEDSRAADNFRNLFEPSAFLAGFVLLLALWVAFFLSLPTP
jgi:uncharacterized membrane protein